MSDILNNEGLQTKTLSVLTTELKDGYKAIYGDDINIDSDSPDGQTIAIYAQAGIDQRELLQSVNSSFDPDQAVGSLLNQRVAINGIIRKSGTFTTTPVTVTVDRALNLQGLDAQSEEISPTNNPFSIKDDAGNVFYLVDSQTIVATTYPVSGSFSFRAANLGAVEVTLNTITTIETVTAGVTSVNNTATPTIGIDEESDLTLRERRSNSIALSSVGYLDSLQAALLNLDGVTTGLVYENYSNVTDVNGIPAHSIWAIIEGGADADIANVIYSKKSAGAGMFGDETYEIIRSNGSIFTASFDRPTNENLYIKLSITYSGVYDVNNLKELIVENIIWQVGQTASTDGIYCYVKSVNNQFIITGVAVSTNGSTWVESVNTTNLNYRFVNDVSRISIV